MVSAGSALLAYHANSDVRWLVGAIVIIASWPYTFFVVVPVNNRLLAGSPGDTSPDSRELVRDWGFLEWGLSAMGLVAAATFAWALS